jgi:hypothetical protein
MALAQAKGGTMSRVDGHFRGVITIEGPKGKLKTFEYDISPGDISLSEVLMDEFAHLRLSRKEKRDFSAEYRRLVRQYERIDWEEVHRASRRFARELANCLWEPITIKAQGLGGFICLSSLAHTQPSANQHWRFNLQSVPIGLYPSHYIQHLSTPHCRVDLSYGRDCWMGKFGFLSEWPSHTPAPWRKVA